MNNISSIENGRFGRFGYIFFFNCSKLLREGFYEKKNVGKMLLFNKS
jgi:hypothetical protein